MNSAATNIDTNCASGSGEYTDQFLTAFLDADFLGAGPTLQPANWNRTKENIVRFCSGQCRSAYGGGGGAAGIGSLLDSAASSARSVIPGALSDAIGSRGAKACEAYTNSYDTQVYCGLTAAAYVGEYLCVSNGHTQAECAAQYGNASSAACEQCVSQFLGVTTTILQTTQENARSLRAVLARVPDAVSRRIPVLDTIDQQLALFGRFLGSARSLCGDAFGEPPSSATSLSALVPAVFGLLSLLVAL